jgi:creatinine amidohydrolase
VNLFDLPDSTVSAALARGVPAFLLVNPIEYHGPHLSLRNDSLVSSGIAEDLHAYLKARSSDPEDFPFLPTRDLDVGVEPTKGPGSEPVSYFAVRKKVLDACRELRRLGARKVVVVTFHGSPLHAYALEAGVSWLERHDIRAFSVMSLLLRELLHADGSRYLEAYAGVEASRRESLARDVASDFHGGYFETSVALHYAPESVRAFYTRVPDCPPFGMPSLVSALVARLERLGLAAAAREISLVARGASWMALRPFPGYTGAPSLASPEAGRVFARLMLELFGPAVMRVLAGAEKSPSPPLPWVRWITLYGLIGVPTPESAMATFPDLSLAAERAIDGAHVEPA